MYSKRIRKLIVLALCAVLAPACSGIRPAPPLQCALVGAGIGGLSGSTIGVITDHDDDDTTQAALIGAGAGAAAGALLGYTICAVLPEAAPPPTAPPPVVRHEPVVKKTVVLPGVYFAFDRSDILPPAKKALEDEVIPELKADPSLTVLIEGHTDAVGSDTYNQHLSEQRAAAVESYMLSHGIEATRIETKGYGESRPIADNDTEAGRAKNRRVEIKELQ